MIYRVSFVDKETWCSAWRVSQGLMVCKLSKVLFTKLQTSIIAMFGRYLLILLAGGNVSETEVAAWDLITFLYFPAINITLLLFVSSAVRKKYSTPKARPNQSLNQKVTDHDSTLNPPHMEAYADIDTRPLNLALTFDRRPGRDYILDLQPSHHFTFRPSTKSRP